jgi:cell division protein FtsN
MDPERDEEGNELPPPSIVSSWWFRALLVLGGLALLVAIALPQLLDWFSPVLTRPAAVQKPQPPAPALRLSPEGTPPTPSPLPPAPRLIEKPPSQPPETPLSSKPAPEVTKPAPKRSVKAAKEEDSVAPSPARGGYMVQVGAFQDEANAARLAARLAKEKYPLQRATESGGGGGGAGHEVVVVGASVDEVNDKLRGTNQKAQATSEGVVIQPALPLKDAVALSQELRAGGLTVKIRRAQGTAARHVVRVGAFPTRSRAEAVRQELEEKGYSGFIVPEARR